MPSLSVSEPARGRGGTILFSGFRRRPGRRAMRRREDEGEGVARIISRLERTRISGVYRVYRGVSRGSRRDSDEWIARKI